jgi:hypothetical protein
VDDDGHDLAALELEAQLAHRVLVQRQSPFERPVEKMFLKSVYILCF